MPTLLWANLKNPYVWIAVLRPRASAPPASPTTTSRSSASRTGLLPRYKLGFQVLVGAIVGLVLLLLQRKGLYSTRLVFPFFKWLIPDLGVAYLPFATFVLLSESNAVNLTDELDGLAISIFTIAAGAYTALTYVVGNRVLAEYLLLVHFPQMAELTVFCGSWWASLGFLWYNSYPAEIFMGDVGSLALGAALATVAILIVRNYSCSSWAASSPSAVGRHSMASFKLTGQRPSEWRRSICFEAIG